ncbi:tRNA 4-thiouridine(8) synthase ThiI [Actinomycetota bacterium]|nr:tRNA 4-thiouridine(8) synthase ThiI [Actinomycetota bacterium]
MVHYHELGLKGHNRRSFEEQLIKNIKSAISNPDFSAEVSRTSGRILVFTANYSDALTCSEIIAKQPGVARVSCGEQVKKDLEQIKEAAIRAIERIESFDSFKVDARRSNTQFELNSMELNQVIGAYLCEAYPSKAVKMKAPDIKVHVEIIRADAYVYAFSKRAVGGLPVGSSGKLVCLLSSGLDSPVAAWQMIKRGAQVIGLHFSGAPETPDSSSYLVKQLAQALAPAGGLTQLVYVHFGAYQRQIALAVPESLRIIIYRRLMFEVANLVAKKLGAKALVTGESLGQVASQTLDNIVAVDYVAKLPVLRPLIGTDKQEIIDCAQKLGTFEISTQSTDDCCTLFMPRRPETHANLAVVNQIWSQLPVDEWTLEIMDNLIIEKIDKNQ